MVIRAGQKLRWAFAGVLYVMSLGRDEAVVLGFNLMQQPVNDKCLTSDGRRDMV
jgi:hypothetical protein